MTDSEIAEQIGAAAEASTVETPTPTRTSRRFEYLLQDNQYDIVFLMERARRIGYDLFVEERDERAAEADARTSGRRRPCTTPTYRLTYGRSLIEFQPELTTANQVGKVTVRGWDAVQEEGSTYTATRERARDQGRRRDAAARTRSTSRSSSEGEIVATKPVESEAEAQHAGDRDPRADRQGHGQGHRLGRACPTSAPAACSRSTALGERFSGRYFVDSHHPHHRRQRLHDAVRVPAGGGLRHAAARTAS